MAQKTKKPAKTTKRKKAATRKPMAKKRKKNMEPMSHEEHEKMGHTIEPMMAANRRPRDQKKNDQLQYRWTSDSRPTRQGNTQQQWTERVAEGQRNPEPAPGTDEFEPEKE